jgi:hypothetical protein
MNRAKFNRRSFKDFEDTLFLPYITHRTWMANIPSHSEKDFCLLQLPVSRKESATV